MKLAREHLLLYAVTDRAWLRQQTLEEQVEAAIKGGVTCVQLREKELGEDAFLKEAFSIRDVCKKRGVPFIVNDNVEIAIKCGADGAHIGQGDMPLREARMLAGPGMIIGVSVQSAAQAVEAESGGADYVGIGAAFPTATKADAQSVSLEEIKAACRAVSIPVVAIGGIGRGNMLSLAGLGLAGVALVSAIFSAKDIESECRALRELAARAAGLA